MRVINCPIRGWICIREHRVSASITKWWISELSNKKFIRNLQLLYYKILDK